MVITVWSDSQRGSLLLPEDFWKAAVEWATVTKLVKALHLECDRVGVDLFLNEDEDPDEVRHFRKAELDHFLAEYIPKHRGCEDPNGICPACWREEANERRWARVANV